MKIFSEILSWRTGSVEVKVKNGKRCVKYFRDEEVGLSLIVKRRRVTSARSEKS